MPTTTYAVKVGNITRLKFRANLADASAPIQYIDGSGQPLPTPFQTADARHRPTNAAELLLDWCHAQGSGVRADDEYFTVKAIDE